MDNNTIYSISRLDSINRCRYEAYRTYVLEERGDKNVYTILGSNIHECLEKIINNKATEKDLLPAMQKELDTLNMIGLEFPKDIKGEDSIRSNWIANMTHFCTNYKSPKKKYLKAEELVKYTTPKGYSMQGYVDLIWQHDNVVDIYDYKTSSLFSKKDLKEHGRQLVFYGIALEAQGYKVRSINWIFTKYVDVNYVGYKTIKSKKKTDIHKIIERRKIYTELSDPISNALKEMNYHNFDIELIIEAFKRTNTIPLQLSKQFKVRPCVIEYDFTEETKKECLEYIEGTIKMWESFSKEDKMNTHRDFTRTQKNGKVINDIYYCTNLCPHKRTCPYISDFIDQFEQSKNEDDLF